MKLEERVRKVRNFLAVNRIVANSAVAEFAEFS